MSSHAINVQSKRTKLLLRRNRVKHLCQPIAILHIKGIVPTQKFNRMRAMNINFVLLIGLTSDRNHARCWNGLFCVILSLATSFYLFPPFISCVWCECCQSQSKPSLRSQLIWILIDTYEKRWTKNENQ